MGKGGSNGIGMEWARKGKESGQKGRGRAGGEEKGGGEEGKRGEILVK